MSRLELPDDAWAVLASPKKVQERKRRRYIAAMADLSAGTAVLPRNPEKPDEPDPRFFGSEQTRLSDAVGDELILCLVKEWSFGPVDGETLGLLDNEQFDLLFRSCRDLAPDLTPDYSENPDPKATTNGSSPPPMALSTAAEVSMTR